MKRCPNCQRTYPDDAPGFCVNDGTQLVTEEAPAYDPQKTILATPPPAAPPPQYNPAPQQPPPQPYQAADPPPQWQPQPPPQAQPPAAPWPPPPPQAQQPGQWGGGGYYQQQPGQQPYAAPYAPQAAGQTKALGLVSFILGLVSALALTLIFLMANQVIDPDRDVAEISFYGSAGLGLVAVVLGVLALISKRQRSKWMAIVGIILGIPAILFFLYVMFSYGAFS